MLEYFVIYFFIFFVNHGVRGDSFERLDELGRSFRVEDSYIIRTGREGKGRYFTIMMVGLFRVEK